MENLQDKNGIKIKVGDTLRSKWGYDVIVFTLNGDLSGKLICEPGHSCEHIPYALNDGSEYWHIEPNEAKPKPAYR